MKDCDLKVKKLKTVNLNERNEYFLKYDSYINLCSPKDFDNMLGKLKKKLKSKLRLKSKIGKIEFEFLKCHTIPRNIKLR